jgi:GxxExxY protein
MVEDKLTERIIGLAIDVHTALGPGLLQSVCEAAGVRFQRQLLLPVVYKGRQIGEYRLDLLVEDSVVVEIKSVDRNTHLLKTGIRRLIQDSSPRL